MKPFLKKKKQLKETHIETFVSGKFAAELWQVLEAKCCCKFPNNSADYLETNVNINIGLSVNVSARSRCQVYCGSDHPHKNNVEDRLIRALVI